MVAAAHPARPFAFIAMPLKSDQLNVVYDCFVRSGLTSWCGIECFRADDLCGSAEIVAEVRAAIEAAALVIADITGANGNVLYEVGLADGMGTPVLLLAQRIEDVPFDLRSRRIVLYQFSPEGCWTLQHDVVRNVHAILGSRARAMAKPEGA